MAHTLQSSPSQMARNSSAVGYYASFNLGSAVRYCLALLSERQPGSAPQQPHARRHADPVRAEI